jgi:hypothetical protein
MLPRGENTVTDSFDACHPVAKKNLILENEEFNPSWHNSIRHDDCEAPCNLLIVIWHPSQGSLQA